MNLLDVLLEQQSDDVKARREEYFTLDQKVSELCSRLNLLRKECKHVVVEYHSTATCLVCRQRLGWYYEKSPTKVCEYDDDQGHELCIHCLDPDERK